MQPKRLTQRLITLIVALSCTFFSVLPVFADTPLYGVCEDSPNEPESGCPGSMTNPLSTLDIEGQLVTLLACKSTSDPLFKVQLASGKIRWVQVGIELTIHTLADYNGITGFDYSEISWPCSNNDTGFKKLSATGNWINSKDPYLTLGNFVDLIPVFQPTPKDLYIDQLWQVFTHKVPNDGETYFTISPLDRAQFMLERWWQFASPSTFNSYYFFVTGKWPKHTAYAYSGKYGLAWEYWFTIQYETEGEEGVQQSLETTILSFAKLPSEATIIGTLCHTPRYIMRGIEFDHLEEDIAFFTYQNQVEQFKLTPSARFLAVFTEQTTPDWGEYYSGIEEFPPTFMVWALCN